MSRGRVRFVGVLGLAVCGVVGCSDTMDELPPVRAGEDVWCGGDWWAAQATYAFKVPTAASLSETCIAEALPGGGEIEFDVAIDARGTVQRVDVPAGLSPVAAACARKVAATYIYFPAHRCDGTPIPSVQRSGFGWYELPGGH